MALAEVKTVFASAARTATPTAVTLDVNRYEELALFIDCTVDPAAASVLVTVSQINPVSGTKTDLLVANALASVSQQVLYIGPSIVASANVAANAVLGTRLEIKAVHADGDSITYSVTAVLR